VFCVVYDILFWVGVWLGIFWFVGGGGGGGGEGDDVSGVCKVLIETFGGCLPLETLTQFQIKIKFCVHVSYFRPDPQINILFRIWITNYPILDLAHKLSPGFRPEPQVDTLFQIWITNQHWPESQSIPKSSPYFRPGSQIKLAIFQAWPTNRHWPELQISTKIDPLLRLKYLRLLEAQCANLAPGDKWSEPWVAKVS